jgi:DNA-binding PucR family transcriptional regulator
MKHIASIFLQKATADTFCCPQMSRLIEYDKEKDRELAKTLYMYLLHGNANAAASALFIHRNTMMYRMDQINKLVKIDYRDHSLRQYLILSYEMMTYQS